jgi:hypothetical protein
MSREPPAGACSTRAARWKASVWDARGAWVWEQRDPAGGLHSAAFSPDGRRLLAVSEDGEARFLDCGLCEPPEVMEARVRALLAPEPANCPLR